MNYPLVFDLGSSSIRVGQAGGDYPSSEVTQLLQQQQQQQHPITRGKITDEDTLQHIFSLSYSTLSLSPSTTPALIVYSPLCSRKERERMVEGLFEEIGVGGVSLCSEVVMSLMSYGSVTGVVGGVGHGVSWVGGVYEGVLLGHAGGCWEFGGTDVDDYLGKRMGGWEGGKEGGRKVKEGLSYVAEEYDVEMEMNVEKSFTLPDGKVITLGKERFQCMERFFQPKIWGEEGGKGGEGVWKKGIHHALLQTVLNCDVEIHQDLFKSMCLVGGSATSEGFRGRMEREMKAIIPSAKRILIPLPMDLHPSWLGVDCGVLEGI